LTPTRNQSQRKKRPRKSQGAGAEVERLRGSPAAGTATGRRSIRKKEHLLERRRRALDQGGSEIEVQPLFLRKGADTTRGRHPQLPGMKLSKRAQDHADPDTRSWKK